VEIIVDRKRWTPPSNPFAPDDLVPVKIAFTEVDLKEIAKASGGRWDPQAKLWFVRYDRVKGTALEGNLVKGVPAKRMPTKGMQ
jgi:hypothetical protein